MSKIDMLLIDYDQATKDAILSQLRSASLDIRLDYADHTNQISGKSYDIYVFGDERQGVPADCEAISNFKRNNPSAKIIVLSDVSDEEYLQELINMRIDGFIDKADIDVGSIISVASSIETFRERANALNEKLVRLHSIQ